MQNINAYIAYLLSRFECVIIPDFGAFISHPNFVGEEKELEYFRHPKLSLGFNSNVRHNDGLLANFILKVENKTYNDACADIHCYVSKLKKNLLQQEIEIPFVGKLYFSEREKIIFIPSNQLSCNAQFFGLSDIYPSTILPELNKSARQPLLKDTKKDFIYISVNRHIFHKVVAVATIFILSVLPTPLNDNLKIQPQQANIIQLSQTQNKRITESKSDSISLQTINESDNLKITKTKQNLKNHKSYYIIIASFPSLKLAEKKVIEFQRNNFPSAQIISSEDRHRIHINKFQDKAMAESFLKQFRLNNPKFASAWLLSMKIKD